MPTDYSYKLWTRLELTQIAQALESALGRSPRLEELAHCCWRRLVECWPLEHVLAEIRGEPPEGS